MMVQNYSGNSVPVLDRARRDEWMNKHTSWRIGGPVDFYFKPENRIDLAEFLSALPVDIPVLWVGLGSNLLVRDGGFRGAVIATHKALDELTYQGDGRVFAEAGVACAKVAKNCARWRCADAHFLAGIPGTIGGALAMNAGAFGGETWMHVASVESIDRSGVISHQQPDEFVVGYRSVSRRSENALDQWFLSATFEFALSEKELNNDIRELLVKRKQAQPIGLPSCGSVFRNPPGDYAARLIEAAGLKDFSIGGACVSNKHANFIINSGGATAADVEALILHIQTEVRQQFGQELIPEVQVVGEAA